MDLIFEVFDNRGKLVRLTKEGWSHITASHSNVTDFDELKKGVVQPLKVKISLYDENVRWNYIYNKEKKRYLFIAIKYLNGNGFIVTAYYMRNIK